jgi:peptide methionine sulfoxide reductase MsrB
MAVARDVREAMERGSRNFLRTFPLACRTGESEAGNSLFWDEPQAGIGRRYRCSSGSLRMDSEALEENKSGSQEIVRMANMFPPLPSQTAGQESSADSVDWL